MTWISPTLPGMWVTSSTRWSSSNPAVATVDTITARVHGISPGTAQIRSDQGDGKYGWVEITVYNVLSVSVSGPTTPEAGQSYSWTSSVTGDVTPYTYSWSIYRDIDGYWQNVGSSSTLNYTVPDDEPYTLMLHVTSPNGVEGFGYLRVEPPTSCYPMLIC
jgi:hypothetical protein